MPRPGEPRLFTYRGREDNITLYLPARPMHTIRSALRLMQKEIPTWYNFVAGHTNRVEMCEHDFSTTNPQKKITYLNPQTVELGRIYCISDMVHEAKHVELDGQTIEHHALEDMCVNTSFDAIIAIPREILKEIGYIPTRNHWFAHFGSRMR